MSDVVRINSLIASASTTIFVLITNAYFLFWLINLHNFYILFINAKGLFTRTFIIIHVIISIIVCLYLSQENIEFLDLSDVDEKEQLRVRASLLQTDSSVQLPWIKNDKKTSLGKFLNVIFFVNR